MSTITFREEYTKQHINNDKKNIIKQSIIDGTLGLSFVYMDKKDDKVHRIFVKENKDDSTFELKEEKNGKEDTKTLSMAEFTKLLKEPYLKFVADYMKERKPAKGDKKTSKGGAKKRSKKSSKKASKKASKKRSKKASMSGGAKKSSKKRSKKSSKKASKKRSKKSSMSGGAKKRSKKASKKGSKKASKKGSKKASKKRSKKGTK
jgi:hypothetical protein